MSSARRPDWKRASVFRVECNYEEGFVREIWAGKHEPLDPLDTISTGRRPIEVLAQSPTREQQAMQSAQKQASAKKLGWVRVPRPLFNAHHSPASDIRIFSVHVRERHGLSTEW